MTWTVSRLRVVAPAIAAAVEHTSPDLDPKATLTADVLERAQARLKLGSNDARLASKILVQLATSTPMTPADASLASTNALFGPTMARASRATKPWATGAISTLVANNVGSSHGFVARADGSFVIAHASELQLWRNGEIERTVAAHTYGTHSITELSDGRIVTTGGDRAACFYDAQLKLMSRVETTDVMQRVTETPEHLILSSLNVVQRWTLAGEHDDTLLMSEVADIAGTAESGFAAVTRTGELRIFTPNVGTEVPYQQRPQLNHVTRLSNGGFAATDANGCHIFDAEGTRLRCIPIHMPSRLIDLGNDQLLIQKDHNSKIWNTATGKLLQTLNLVGTVEHIAALPDGRIATISCPQGSKTRELRVWDTPK